MEVFFNYLIFISNNYNKLNIFEITYDFIFYFFIFFIFMFFLIISETKHKLKDQKGKRVSKQ